MSRTININGVLITLVRGLDVPANPMPGRGKGPLRPLLDAMEVGESVFLGADFYNPKTQSNTLSNATKATGKTYVARTEGDGTRIYCTGMKASPVRAKSAAPSVNSWQVAA